MKGRKPVPLTPAAREELLEATNYYDNKRSELAEDFLDRVQETLTRIGEAPHAESLAPGFEADGVRRARVRRFPYRVFFLELEDMVRVIALAHERRRPGYWRHRLADT